MPAIDIPMQEETKWHAIPVAEILKLQSTSAEGLTDSEAEARLKTYGTNELTPPPKPSFLMKVFIQVNNILIYILIAAAIVTGPHLSSPLPPVPTFAASVAPSTTHLASAPRWSEGLASLLSPETRDPHTRVVLREWFCDVWVGCAGILNEYAEVALISGVVIINVTIGLPLPPSPPRAPCPPPTFAINRFHTPAHPSTLD